MLFDLNFSLSLLSTWGILVELKQFIIAKYVNILRMLEWNTSKVSFTLAIPFILFYLL
jgi:flagellar assembly factor FliW